MIRWHDCNTEITELTNLVIRRLFSHVARLGKDTPHIKLLGDISTSVSDSFPGSKWRGGMRFALTTTVSDELRCAVLSVEVLGD